MGFQKEVGKWGKEMGQREKKGEGVVEEEEGELINRDL